MRRLALVCVCAFALAGCGVEKDKQQAGQPCGAAPAALSGSPTLLPSTFPTPNGVVYVSEKKAGPSTIVDGFHPGDLTSTHDEYKAALSTGGYVITKDEQDVADSEIAFSGHSTTGQVAMKQGCADRTTLAITIRPG